MFLRVFICADVCSVFPVARGGHVEFAEYPEPHSTSGSGSKEPSRVRVEFPETWLWSESSTGYCLMPGHVVVLVKCV